MNALLLALPGLAFALLAAHFHRASAWPLALGCVALIVLLALRRRWVAWLAQACLAAGALEWAWTAAVYVQQRIALGQPWVRLAVILGGVALLTAASALVFRTRRLQARFVRA
jgi:hypothetical protein